MLPARAPRVIKPLAGRSERLFKRAAAANRGGKVGRPSGGAAAGGPDLVDIASADARELLDARQRTPSAHRVLAKKLNLLLTTAS